MRRGIAFSYPILILPFFLAQCSMGVDAAAFGGKCMNRISKRGGGGGERLTEFCSDGGQGVRAP